VALLLGVEAGEARLVADAAVVFLGGSTGMPLFRDARPGGAEVGTDGVEVFTEAGREAVVEKDEGAGTAPLLAEEAEAVPQPLISAIRFASLRSYNLLLLVAPVDPLPTDCWCCGPLAARA
jgi:hypothetical protein